MRDALQRSHLFVLACIVADDGDRDGIPVAMMEALAMETPVISTPVSGVPELIRHEQTGLLVPERDAAALAAAISRMAEDQALRQKLASSGRELVTAQFDSRKNAVMLVNLFSRVIEEGGTGN